MEEVNTFTTLTDIIRQADAYVFLAGWLYMMYTKRLRWGWDYDKTHSDLQAENQKLREVITRYQDKVEERLERLERSGESSEGGHNGKD